MIKLAGMVTLYNPTDEDIKNIDTYIKDVDILYVIDNTEGKSNEKRLPKSKKIKYIFKNENVGVAKALNDACKMAIKDGYDYILTNDQDTHFNKDVVKGLKKVVEKENMEKIGIVVPWHNTKLKLEKLTNKYDYPELTITSANILNLKIWKKLGGFKEYFFIDGIDTEYSLNLKKHGYKILRVNYLEVDHSLGDLKYNYFFNKEYVCSNHNYIRRYYITRNNHYIFDLYKDFDPDRCWHLLKERETYIGILLFEKDKFRKIRAMRRGLKDYKNKIKGKYPY